MRVLIAEDDAVTARLVSGLIQSWGYDVIAVKDGAAAAAVLQTEDAPQLALLDWMMPGLSGVDVCRLARERQSGVTPYLILMTSRSDRADVVAGLEAGADDYLVKPVDREELRARLKAGARIMDLQTRLSSRAHELELALANVRRLSGLLPICAYCKSIRDDSDYWHQVEEYVSKHADVQFSHGICPTCLEAVERELER